MATFFWRVRTEGRTVTVVANEQNATDAIGPAVNAAVELYNRQQIGPKELADTINATLTRPPEEKIGFGGMAFVEDEF